MKTFYKISGIVFIFGCFFFLKYSFKEIETYYGGHVIIATVIYVPNCFTTKKHYNIKFIYNGKTYAKEIGVLSCKKLKVGNSIRMKTNQDNSVFLYEQENPFYDMVSIIFLLLFGVFLVYLGYKK